MISLFFYLSTWKTISFWPERVIRSWGFTIWFQQDKIPVGYPCSFYTLSTPAQQEVLFPHSSTSQKPSQKLSASVSPGFPPSFSVQTYSCESRWKLQLPHLHSAPKEICLTCHVAFLSRAFILGRCLSCCMEQFTPFTSPFHDCEM